MTEYWKSLPKHWCIYCKIFLVDNKANRKYHESSLKHKDNMKKYIEKASKSTTSEPTKQERISVYDKTIHNHSLVDQNDQLVFGSSKNDLLTNISPITLLHPSTAPLVEMKQPTISKLKINLHPTISDIAINSIEKANSDDQEDDEQDDYQQLDLNPSKKRHMRKYDQ